MAGWDPFHGWMKFDFGGNPGLTAAFTIGYRFTDDDAEEWTERFNRFKKRERLARLGAAAVLERAVPDLVRGLGLAASKTVFVPALSSGETVATKKRMLWRMTRFCAEAAQVRFAGDAISKKAHEPLHTFWRAGSSEQRRKILEDAEFRAEKIEADYIVIFDDFITSGSTLEHIAQAIQKRNRGTRIFGVGLCRATRLSYHMETFDSEISNDHVPGKWKTLWTKGEAGRRTKSRLDTEPMSSKPSTTAISLLALMMLKGIGRRQALKIVDRPMPEECIEIAQEALMTRMTTVGRHHFSGSEISDAWMRSKNKLDQGTEVGVQAISIHDEAYPARLRETGDPPAVLFVKGNVQALHYPKTLAIVGTREPTRNGGKFAQICGRTAADKGYVIVSGLAQGCDTYAHEGCLESGGIGVAVLAHGLDKVYPTANRGLAERLLEHGGCLTSEYPVGSAPSRQAFVERDRIQSGLANAVLVIETGERSGTMNTVEFARKQARPIACIEHPQQLHSEDMNKGKRRVIDNYGAIPIPDRDALVGFLNDPKIMTFAVRQPSFLS